MNKILRVVAFTYLVLYVAFTLFSMTAYILWGNDPALKTFNESMSQLIQLIPAYLFLRYLRSGFSDLWLAIFAAIICYIGPLGSAYMFRAMPYTTPVMYAILAPIFLAMLFIAIVAATKKRGSS